MYSRERKDLVGIEYVLLHATNEDTKKLRKKRKELEMNNAVTFNQ